MLDLPLALEQVTSPAVTNESQEAVTAALHPHHLSPLGWEALHDSVPSDMATYYQMVGNLSEVVAILCRLSVTNDNKATQLDIRFVDACLSEAKASLPLVEAEKKNSSEFMKPLHSQRVVELYCSTAARVWAMAEHTRCSLLAEVSALL